MDSLLEGKASPNFGRSHVHWLTGTASTVMVGCVEGILGMRPDFYGLHIAPSIPKAWDGFEIEKDFRGYHLHIVVKNPDHVESGCKSLLVNGQAVEGDYIQKSFLASRQRLSLPCKFSVGGIMTAIGLYMVCENLICNCIED